MPKLTIGKIIDNALIPRVRLLFDQSHTGGLDPTDTKDRLPSD